MVYTISIFIALSLATTIALLIWYLRTSVYVNYSNNQTNFTCPPDPCPSTTMMSTSSTQTMISLTSSTTTMTMQTSVSVSSSSSTNKKRTYKESCNQLFDCYTEYGLLCEYGWNETKSCLCEGSHYWSIQQNKCRKMR